MARNSTVNLTAQIWTQLTNGNAAAVRVQNLGSFTVHLQATAGEVQPTNKDGALLLQPQQTMAGDLTIAQLWPGVSGANRLWALCDLNSTLSVSHADA